MGIINSAKLSVIVPLSSKREDLSNLEFWLNELQKFENLNYEVLIVLDIHIECPTSIIESIIFKLQNPKVRLIQGNYGSPGSARNAGLNEANGSHICFWDSDDSPNLINVFSHLMKNPGRDKIVVGDYILHSLKERRETSVRDRSLVDLSCSPGIWRFIFPRERICGLNFPDLSMAEDQVFFLKVKIKESDIIWSHTHFYKYYTGNNSQLTQDKNAKKDLKNSILEVLTLFEGESHKELDVYRDIIFWRLFYTGLKNQVNFRLRVSFIFTVWKRCSNLKIHISFFRPIKCITTYQIRKFSRR